ncbi:MAG: GNAT family N-acetyltransferase [Dysgonomonas sp.]
MIVKATEREIDIVKSIVCETIKEIYPKYYPQDVVNLFLNHHSEENILTDLQKEIVFLLFKDGKYVATGTTDGEYMSRVYVLPEFQGKGHGGELMEFLESVISSEYGVVRLHASLPAFNIYLKRGYKVTEYCEEETENGCKLCYQIMEREMEADSDNYPNLDGRLFKGIENTASGEVSQSTVFHYHQQGNTIWASYSGGDIQKGFLLGYFVDKFSIKFSYQHINTKKEIRIGECQSLIENLTDGKFRLHESWQWLDKDKMKGHSVVEEIKNINI